MIQSADIKYKKQRCKIATLFFFTHQNNQYGENTEFFSEKHLLVLLLKNIYNFTLLLLNPPVSSISN